MKSIVNEMRRLFESGRLLDYLLYLPTAYTGVRFLDSLGDNLDKTRFDGLTISLHFKMDLVSSRTT